MVCKFPEVPVILVEGESLSLPESKTQVRQFLAVLDPFDLEAPPAVAPQELPSIDLLAGDLEGEAGCDLSNVMGGLYFGSLATVCGDCGRLFGACSVVNESVPSSVADIL